MPARSTSRDDGCHRVGDGPAPPPNGERIAATRAHGFARDVLLAVGMPMEEATLVADQLVWRDLREGAPTGLAALPSCVEGIVAGTTDPRARPAIVGEVGAVAVLDAGRAWGQVAAVHAMRVAVERARTSGLGLTLVRNSRTANAMGFYPTIAIEAGMIGLVITDSEPLQAPWGGTTRVLGNQAFAFGCPARRHHPLLFDTATTAISKARINSLARRGERLPPGVALDGEGRPTLDPVEALEGMLVPAAGHKGYGLAVMWEVLTGALAGLLRADDRAAGPVRTTSLFVLAIDPRVSGSHEQFIESVDDLIDRIHASPPGPGVERVYAPGERGFITAEERAQTGIPISAARIVELRALGEGHGVAW